jgi:DNA-binding IclR family transcriptional regulator
VLEELVAETGETAHLGILRGQEVAHVDGVLPNQLLLTGSRVGERLPAHCTAIGKALLIGALEKPAAPANPRAEAGARRPAAAPPGPGILAWKLERFTDGTITDGTKLLDEIRASQLRGYALDLEEFAAGLHCVAAPVRDASERVVAAISLSGPSQRFSRDAVHGEGARAVTAAANRLSRALGARDAGAQVLGTH